MDILHKHTGAVLFRCDTDLAGANLSGVNLWCANLVDANLKSTNLRGVDLGNANLVGADLWNANLMNANLLHATLIGANLRDANLMNANLIGADLRGAKLEDADLWGVKFGKADLSNVNLGNADLGGVNLRGANLKSANLSGADLMSANLIDADLIDADLRGAKGVNPFLICKLKFLRDQVGKIRAYKLVNHQCEGPIKGGIVYEIGKEYIEPDFDDDEFNNCGKGINLATLDWCIREWIEGFRIFVAEFTRKDIVAIPHTSDGKFRVKKCKIIGEKNLVEIGLKPEE